MHRLCKDNSLQKHAFEEYFERVRNEFGDEKLLHLLSQKDERKYLPIHTAIFHRNIVALEALLDGGVDPDAKCHGTPPLHLSLRSAAQPQGFEFGSQAATMLLQAKANCNAKDDNGYTVFHIVAMYNFKDLLEKIAANGQGASQALAAQGKYDGFTALHIAAMYDSEDCAEALLRLGISATSVGKVCGSTALHLAAMYGSKRVYELLLKVDDKLAQIKDAYGKVASEPKASNDVHSLQTRKTGIFSSRFCRLHHSCIPSLLHTSHMPPENLWRIHVLIDENDGVLFSHNLRNRLRFNLAAHSAALCDVLQVHDWSYVRRVQAACEILSEDPESENGLAHLDGDTAVSRHSYDAALGAAGAVCSAVDAVVAGELRNAFCAVRPPGHHVGSKGATKSATGSDSHGFCLLNNVSIGAAHAMNRHRDSIQRVLIVDFDVHHGNGTEQTVKNLRPSVQTVSFNDPAGIFGSLCLPQYKPWRDEHDAENVLFVSVHGYGPPQRGLEHAFPQAAFYPGTGPTTLPNVKPKHAYNEDEICEFNATEPMVAAHVVNRDIPTMEDESVNEMNADDKLSSEDAEEDGDEDDSDYIDGANKEEEGSVDEGDGEMQEIFGNSHQLSHTLHMYDFSNPASRAVSRAASPMILDIGVPLPQEPMQSEDTIFSKLLADFEYRHTWRNYFRDHIFPRIDTFAPDLVLISAGFDAHRRDTINAGYIALGEDDFVWVTERLLALANTHSKGRLVSVLEGGYSIAGEFASAFAKSVAAHVETLTRGDLPLPNYSQQAMLAEKAAEIKYMAALRTAHESELERKHREQQAFFQRQKELYEAQHRITEEEKHHTDVVPQEDNANSKKRKRQVVDYTALEEKLRQEEKL